MDYYAMKTSFDRIKVNFTGISTGRGLPQYFDVFSINSDRLTIKLGSMRNLTFDKVPLKPVMGIFDLETNMQLGSFEDAFSIIEPLLIQQVRPLA
jgi:hypothetical protein